MGHDRSSGGAAVVSALERISGEPQAYKTSASVPADRRSVLQRLSGELVLPERSETQALQCKLACIVSWMHSQRIDVPLPALMMLSEVQIVREHAAGELLQKCQKRQNKCETVIGDTITIDDKTALRLAIAECELLTAPVTARSASSVDDASYIGCQLRRTLSTRLFSGAVASFALGCLLTFIHVSMPQTGPLHWQGFAIPDVRPIVQCLLAPNERLCWGLVGASFYLLRRLYDFTEQRTFDYRLVGMYKVRLIMGGIAGGILSLLIDGDIGADTSSKAVFGSHAIAFIGGFSVRAVYAMIERATEVVRDLFSRPHVDHAKPAAAVPPTSRAS